MVNSSNSKSQNAKSINKIFADAISQARLDAGLTQTELAKKIGKSQNIIARAESGNHHPSPSLIESIADALNKKVEFKFESFNSEKYRNWTFPLTLYPNNSKYIQRKKKEVAKWAKELTNKISSFLEVNRLKYSFIEFTVSSSNVSFYYFLDSTLTLGNFHDWDRLLGNILGLNGIHCYLEGKKLRIDVHLPQNLTLPIDMEKLVKDGLTDRFDSPLSFVLGADKYNSSVTLDLAKHSSLLIAGTAGSGKTLGTINLATSIMAHTSPSQVDFSIIDPKKVEFTWLENSPFASDYINDSSKILPLFEKLLEEKARRIRLLEGYNVKNITEFNKAVDKQKIKEDKLAYKIILFDEYDLAADVSGKNFCSQLNELIKEDSALLGIHTVLISQHPMINLFRDINPDNISSRWIFRTGDSIATSHLTEHSLPHDLNGQGDSYLVETNKSNITRLQAGYIGGDTLNEIEQYLEQKYSK